MLSKRPITKAQLLALYKADGSPKLYPIVPKTADLSLLVVYAKHEDPDQQVHVEQYDKDMLLEPHVCVFFTVPVETVAVLFETA